MSEKRHVYPRSNLLICFFKRNAPFTIIPILLVSLFPHNINLKKLHHAPIEVQSVPFTKEIRETYVSEVL